MHIVKKKTKEGLQKEVPLQRSINLTVNQITSKQHQKSINFKSGAFKKGTTHKRHHRPEQ
jgi:hypothetical protein